MSEHTFSEEEDYQILIVRYTVNSLSFIGSLFIIIVYLCIKDL